MYGRPTKKEWALLGVFLLASGLCTWAGREGHVKEAVVCGLVALAAFLELESL